MPIFLGFEHRKKAVLLYKHFHFLKSQVFSSTLNNSSSFNTSKVLSIISYNTTHHQCCSDATIILAHIALNYENFAIQRSKKEIHSEISLEITKFISKAGRLTPSTFEIINQNIQIFYFHQKIDEFCKDLTKMEICIFLGLKVLKIGNPGPGYPGFEAEKPIPFKWGKTRVLNLGAIAKRHYIHRPRAKSSTRDSIPKQSHVYI